MKLIFLSLALCSLPVFGGPPVVRSYALEPDDLRRFQDWDAPKKWEGREIKTAPFQSRLFKKGDELRDWSKEVSEILELKKFDGQVVWNERSERFVIKAEEAVHWRFRDVMKDQVIKNPQVTVSIYSFPKAPDWDGGSIWNGLPEGGRLTGELSWLGGFKEMKSLATRRERLVIDSGLEFSGGNFEGKLKVKSRIKRSEFSFDGTVSGVVGLPWVMEVGTKENGASLFLVVTCEWVRSDGSAFDDWILKEDGTSLLRGERFEMAEGNGLVLLGEVKGVRRHSVPAGLVNLLTVPKNAEKPQGGAVRDPFATDQSAEKEVPLPRYSGSPEELGGYWMDDLHDLRPYLERNGLKFRKDDFVILRSREGVLFARLSKENLGLLNSVMGKRIGELPRAICFDFELWESDTQLTEEGLLQENGAVMRKISMKVADGSSGQVTLGDDLVVDVNAQIVDQDEEIEVRSSLSQVGGTWDRETFKSGFLLKKGQPLLIHQSHEGETWRSWVVTGRPVTREKGGKR